MKSYTFITSDVRRDELARSDDITSHTSRSPHRIRSICCRRNTAESLATRASDERRDIRRRKLAAHH